MQAVMSKNGVVENSGIYSKTTQFIDDLSFTRNFYSSLNI